MTSTVNGAKPAASESATWATAHVVTKNAASAPVEDRAPRERKRSATAMVARSAMPSATAKLV